MGGLTWDALLCTHWWVGRVGKVTREGQAKRWPSAPQSCGGRAVGSLGTSMQTPAFPRLGAALGMVRTPQVSLSTVRVMVFHCWDSDLECMPWEGWQAGQVGSVRAPG